MRRVDVCLCLELLATTVASCVSLDLFLTACADGTNDLLPGKGSESVEGCFEACLFNK